MDRWRSGAGLLAGEDLVHLAQVCEVGGLLFVLVGVLAALPSLFGRGGARGTRYGFAMLACGAVSFCAAYLFGGVLGGELGGLLVPLPASSPVLGAGVAVVALQVGRGAPRARSRAAGASARSFEGLGPAPHPSRQVLQVRSGASRRLGETTVSARTAPRSEASVGGGAR